MQTVVDGGAFQVFFAPLLSAQFRKQASVLVGIPVDELSGYLDAYIHEANYAWERIQSFLPEGAAVLEVGAGLGLLSLFLADHGVDVVANTHDSDGFGKMAPLRRLVLEQYPNISLPLLSGPIEQVAFVNGRKFDFIFSLNVIEHMKKVEDAMQAMARLLNSGGLMWHSCPNYRFPYEPHLAIFLLPFFPEKTSHLFPSLKEKKFGVWHSLNFVTAGVLERAAGQAGLVIAFQPHVFYRHLLRLFDDPAFRRRHGLLYPLVMVLRYMGLLRWMRCLPARLMTPVEFVLCWRDAGEELAAGKAD